MDIIQKNLDEMSMLISNTATTATDENNLRILLISTHIHQVTGYAKVAYNLIKQIAAIPKVKLIHYGFQRTLVPQNNLMHRQYPENVEEIDVVQLPSARADGGFGFGDIVHTVKTKKPDILFFYNDIGVVNKYIDMLRKSDIDRSSFKIWVYMDQIYTQQKRIYLDGLNRDTDRVFVFSDYWKGVLKSQGVTRPISVINHGFEASDFMAIPKDVIRRNLGLSPSHFLFMSLNRNLPRKRLDIAVMAFAELVVKHPQKPIYMLMICGAGDNGGSSAAGSGAVGWDLLDIYVREVKRHGGMIEAVSDRLMIAEDNKIYSDMDINMLYNAADVGISAAEGEGWGLCSFEMMGVGKPQVVSDVGGHKDFCINDVNSLVVPVRYRYYLPNAYCSIGGEAGLVDPSEFSAAMEKYVMDSELIKKHGAAARETVRGYTWEKVTETLKKCILKEIDGGDDI